MFRVGETAVKWGRVRCKPLCRGFPTSPAGEVDTKRRNFANFGGNLEPCLPLLHCTPSSWVSTAGAAASVRQPILRPPWGVFAAHFNSLTFRSLTDTRFPKRRPGEKPRKKRAALKPKGPFVWIQSSPGEPLPTSQPNAGSIKSRGRNRKKRIAQRKAFIAAEVKKRKEAFKEHKRKKSIEKIERKMAAVAREKAWAERLIELQQLEEAKKAARAQ